MPQPLDVVALSDKLEAVYREAQARIAAELAALVDDPRQFRQRRRLVEMRTRIDSLMDNVDSQAQAWYINDSPEVFYAGISGVRDALGITDFSHVNVDAVNQLLNGLYDDLLAATRRVRVTTKQMIRAVAESEITQGVVTGEGLSSMRDAMTSLLNDRGIYAVKYANGAEIDLDTYAAMTVRTTTALAYNLGTLQGAAGAGVEWFEVFDGDECGWEDHDDPDLADGSIRSGDECDANPIAHPNCRRSFGPRPDITSAQEAADGVRTAPSFEPEPGSTSGAASSQRVAARDQRLASRAASIDQRLDEAG